MSDTVDIVALLPVPPDILVPDHDGELKSAPNDIEMNEHQVKKGYVKMEEKNGGDMVIMSTPAPNTADVNDRSLINKLFDPLMDIPKLRRRKSYNDLIVPMKPPPLQRTTEEDENSWECDDHDEVRLTTRSSYTVFNHGRGKFSKKQARDDGYDGVVENILDVPPKIVAEQITLANASLFVRIRRSEFEACITTKDVNNTPNLTAMTNLFNQITLWASSEILTSPTACIRLQKISYFMEVAKRCYSLNDFSGLKSVLTALECTPVFRLKRTWSLVPTKDYAIFEKLRSFMSADDNFAFYRKRIKLIHGAGIPFMGVHASDLVYLHEAKKYELSRNNIDHARERHAHIERVLDRIQMYQARCTYDVEMIPSVYGLFTAKKYISELHSVMEDMNFSRSYMIEPKSEKVGAVVVGTAGYGKQGARPDLLSMSVDKLTESLALSTPILDHNDEALTKGVVMEMKRKQSKPRELTVSHVKSLSQSSEVAEESVQVPQRKAHTISVRTKPSTRPLSSIFSPPSSKDTQTTITATPSSTNFIKKFWQHHSRKSGDLVATENALPKITDNDVFDDNKISGKRSSLKPDDFDSEDNVLKKSMSLQNSHLRSHEDISDDKPHNISIIKEGWLTRKVRYLEDGERSKNRRWERMWVRVTKEGMYGYHKRQIHDQWTQSLKDVKLVIHWKKESRVEHAEDYTKRVNVFRVRPTSEGDILFQAESDIDVKQWVALIRKAIPNV